MIQGKEMNERVRPEKNQTHTHEQRMNILGVQKWNKRGHHLLMRDGNEHKGKGEGKQRIHETR